MLGHAGRSRTERSLSPAREYGSIADMGTSRVDRKQDQGTVTHLAAEVLERFTAAACPVLAQRV
jgi:hypothetical protein